MATAQELIIRFIGDSASAKRAAKDTSDAVDRTTASVKRSSAEFKKMDAYINTLGARMGRFKWALAGVGAAAVILGKQSVKSASDLTETMNKARVVFGDSADEVLKFGENAAKSMGLSKRAAIEATATYGNLFVSMGIGQERAAKMSMTITKLAADLASFNNTPVDDALLALRAGLVGEIEPLRRFGINLNEAMLKEEALRQGLIRSAKGTLPAAVKAQAAYRIILKQSTTAQGDFARTADGLANKQKILNALWEDSKASLGNNLIPYLVDATDALNGLLEAYDRKSDVQKVAMQQDATMVGSIALLTRYFGLQGLAVGLAGSAAAKFGQLLSGPVANGITKAVTGGNDLKTLYFLSSTAADGHSRSVSNLTMKTDMLTDAQKELADAFVEAREAAYAEEDAQIADARSHFRLKDAKKAMNKAIKEHGKNSREAREAVLDYREAVLAAKRADDALKTSNIEALRSAWRKAERAAENYISTARRANSMKTSGGGRAGVQRFAIGGLATGPTSGYAAELHGREWVIPAVPSPRSRALLSAAAKDVGGGGITIASGAVQVTVGGSNATAYDIERAVESAMTKVVRRAGRLST